MAIERFITGHKYIYLGVTRRNDTPHGWNEKMDFVLLPQVVKCTGVDNKVFARFLGQPRSFRKHWNWYDVMSDWVDVTKMPEKEIQKILAEKRRRMVAEKI